MIDLTPLLQAVISLAAALVTVYLIPWIKAKTTAEEQAKIRAAIQIAVYGAEKMYGAGQGPEKFRYAQEWLRSQGFDLDIGTLKMEIDAAIKEMEQAEWVIDDGAELDEEPAEG